MIKRLTVLGLNQKINADLKFHEDINIITGKNGSGKTTLLKLIWYLISGNIERIMPEIQFDEVSIETDRFSLAINVNRSETSIRIKINLDIDGFEIFNRDFSYDEFDRYAHQINHQIIDLSESSVFFPTFRRIEGGFSLDRSASRRPNSRITGKYSPLQQIMAEISSSISVDRHVFVASISTDDVVELLTQQYADISEKTNALHSLLSDFITTRINEYSRKQKLTDSQSLESAQSVLHEIQEQVNNISRQREILLRPFSVLSELINSIFQYRGIRVTEGITLGETKEAIASDKLSAGEKQMLSFLCYNAFTKDSTFFIDEPELSLHVDWQRLLFPTLLKQETGNQFIVATHSPFIYSKFADKELLLDSDRGGE